MTASDAITLRRNRQIAVWLFSVIAMVFVMVILGGVTRLTHSGLSMVDWRPITGWLPPLNESEWMAVFDLYKQSPEYLKVNKGMDLGGFQSIFWLEFLHRLWGRVIGAAFLLPFVFFLVRGRVGKGLAPKLIFMFVLGGLQGLMGWYMVKSGLVDRPDVSQYRLTAHFSLALVIIGYIQWVAMGLLFGDEGGKAGAVAPGLRRFAALLALIAFVTALSGGFVAGTDAGFAYNTFPLMDGAFLPADAYAHPSLAHNLFEDLTTIQFNHRLLAESLFVLVAVFWWQARRQDMPERARTAVNAMAAVVTLQVFLGITTLLLTVPVALGAAHQAGAVIVFMTALWAAWETRSS